MKIPQPETLSDNALAKAMGCDRTSLREWRKRGDAPTTNDPEAWSAYCELHGLGRFLHKTKTQLQEAKLERENKLLDLKIAREEGTSIALAEMGDFVARFSARLDQLLTLKLEVEGPPRVVGKDIVATRAELRTLHDEIRSIYNAGLLEWKPRS